MLIPGKVGIALAILLAVTALVGLGLVLVPEGGSSPMSQAVQHRRLDRVRSLLAAGEDPDARGGSDVRTPLGEAAWSDETNPYVEALLEGGANPNLGDHFGTTPLEHAARQGALSNVRSLLAHGAANPVRSTSDRYPNACDAAEQGGSPTIIGLLC